VQHCTALDAWFGEVFLHNVMIWIYSEHYVNAQLCMQYVGHLYSMLKHKVLGNKYLCTIVTADMYFPGLQTKGSLHSHTGTLEEHACGLLEDDMGVSVWLYCHAV